MVGQRQLRETRMQIGEALAVGGVIMLVVTPLVYKVRLSNKHVVSTRSAWWPTSLMWLPLAALVIGVLVMVAASNLGTRRKSRAIVSTNDPTVDLVAEEARDSAAELEAGDARTASRSTT